MEDVVKISYSLTIDDTIEFFMMYYREKKFKKMLLQSDFWMTILLAPCFWLLSSKHGAWPVFLVLWFLSSIGMHFYMKKDLPYKFEKKLRNFHGNPKDNTELYMYEMEIGTTGIINKSSKGSTETYWHSITEIEEKNNKLYIWQSELNALVIPIESVISGNYEEFKIELEKIYSMKKGAESEDK